MGDVRDVVAIRKLQEWEIGVSAKKQPQSDQTLQTIQ
ncbi:hypothetical protein BSPWISOXPB_8018 [uncultured Gammaproteobacteria bacterium]|nr:hypothetical protein BSPWISOXPB_8018 [uncultured Gammaproteobacteria bacterium]